MLRSLTVFLLVLISALCASAQGVGQGSRVIVQGSRNSGVYQQGGVYNNGYYNNGGYRTYGSGVAIGAVRVPGIRFNLRAIPDDMKDLVQSGIVAVDGFTRAFVDDHDSKWHNGVLPLSIGRHNVSVTLANGCRFESQVNVTVYRVEPVPVIFTPGCDRPVVPPPTMAQPIQPARPPAQQLVPPSPPVQPEAMRSIPEFPAVTRVDTQIFFETGDQN